MNLKNMNVSNMADSVARSWIFMEIHILMRDLYSQEKKEREIYLLKEIQLKWRFILSFALDIFMYSVHF